MLGNMYWITLQCTGEDDDTMESDSGGEDDMMTYCC